MRQTSSALDERLEEGLRRVKRADILVGIPSYNNAGTVAHVARTVAAGLRERFPDQRAVIVNADGGSRDGTPDVLAASTGDVPTITGAYHGIPGKGSALRAIFEAGVAVDAGACAVVDSDLRSISVEWIERLVRPVLEDRADYMTPLYARHKHDGTITNTIAYPLTRALYGRRVRQPIGGEFGFSGRLARQFLDQPVWETDVAKFGIDIFMTTTALTAEARVAQAFLGAKVHDPKDPGADLGPMFVQVVGTAFRLAAAHRDAWRPVRASRDVPLVGSVDPVEPDPIAANVELLDRKLAAGAEEHGALWEEILGARPRTFDDDAWAAIVYDFLAAAADRPDRTDAIVLALLPLYFGRVARFIRDAETADAAAAEALVEAQARSFERAKARLVDRLA